MTNPHTCIQAVRSESLSLFFAPHCYSPLLGAHPGDLEHTHLVKGLDYALLSKVKSEMVPRKAGRRVAATAGAAAGAAAEDEDNDEGEREAEAPAAAASAAAAKGK